MSVLARTAAAACSLHTAARAMAALRVACRTWPAQSPSLRPSLASCHGCIGRGFSTAVETSGVGTKVRCSHSSLSKQHRAPPCVGRANLKLELDHLPLCARLERQLLPQLHMPHRMTWARKMARLMREGGLSARRSLWTRRTCTSRAGPGAWAGQAMAAQAATAAGAYICVCGAAYVSPARVQLLRICRANVLWVQHGSTLEP